LEEALLKGTGKTFNLLKEKRLDVHGHVVATEPLTKGEKWTS
jgi:predicted glutamine amidotransferase